MLTIRSRWRIPLAAALAAMALLVAATTASAAGIGGFSVSPAQSSARGQTGRSYFVIPARPGSQRRDAVVVSNHDDKPLSLYVDPVDGLTGTTSGVVYGNRGAHLRSAGAWVTPDVRRVTVPAGRTIDVGFTVRIPRGATPGDHLAGLSLQVAKGTKSNGSVSVTVVVRAVVGIEVQVPGAAAPRIRISGLALGTLPGTTVPAAMVTLEDVGGKLCQPHLAVALSGRGITRRATQVLGTILPGDRIAYPFKWPGQLGYGRYSVTATATRCGPATVRRAVATFSAPRNSQASSASPPPLPALTARWPFAKAAANQSGSKWLYGLLGVVALLAAGLAIVVGRRTGGRSRLTGPGRTQPKPGAGVGD